MAERLSLFFVIFVSAKKITITEMNIKLFASLSLWALALTGMAQEKVVPVKYGDMNQWVTRRIYESGIIGGHTKLLL